MRISGMVSVVGLVLALAAPQAMAQATRTWVSGVGDDANPCSRTAPCKTFAGAISKTAARGEINIIDAGGFGAVTITKAITIDGEGSLGGDPRRGDERSDRQRRRRATTIVLKQPVDQRLRDRPRWHALSRRAALPLENVKIQGLQGAAGPATP